MENGADYRADGYYVMHFENEVMKMTKIFQDAKDIENAENLEREPDGFYLEIK